MTDESGIPPDRPTKRGVRSRPITVTIVALLLLGGGTYYFTSTDPAVNTNDSDHPGGDTTGTPSFTCEDAASGTGITEPEAAPTNGGVEVAEQNMVVAEPNSVGRVAVSFGAVLDNTTELAARNVKVRFEIDGPDGTVGVIEESSVDQKPLSIPFIRPGEQFGLGEGSYVDDVADDDALELRVSIEVGEWWRPDNDKHQFPSLTGEVTEAHIDVPTAPIVFDVDNSACADQPNGLAAAVYRDTDGDIVGGYFGLPVYQPLPDGRDPGGTGDTEDFVNDDDNRLDYPSGHLEGAWSPEPALTAAKPMLFDSTEIDSTSTMLYPYSPTDD